MPGQIAIIVLRVEIRQRGQHCRPLVVADPASQHLPSRGNGIEAPAVRVLYERNRQCPATGPHGQMCGAPRTTRGRIHYDLMPLGPGTEKVVDIVLAHVLCRNEASEVVAEDVC